jgi:hypothetical protein
LDVDIEEVIIQTVREDSPETISHLIELTEKKVLVPRNEIIKSILQLQREGKIVFSESTSVQVAQNLSAYLKTKASLWYWVTVGLTFLSAVVVFSFQSLGLQGCVRYAMGSIFVLGLPGYSLVRVLFSSKFVKLGRKLGIDNLTVFSLSVVLSIALVSLVGLVLNYTPWGVQLSSIVLSLSSLNVVFATAAIVRENHEKNKVLGDVEKWQIA